MGSTEPYFKRFIFILIDGGPYEVFKALIENGDLPNIKKTCRRSWESEQSDLHLHLNNGPRLHPLFHGVVSGYSKRPGSAVVVQIEFSTSKPF